MTQFTLITSVKPYLHTQSRSERLGVKASMYECEEGWGLTQFSP
jgi:hypothetical protein